MRRIRRMMLFLLVLAMTLTLLPAQAMAEEVHDHSYGDWSYLDTQVHQSLCECGDVRTEPHSYGEWTQQDADNWVKYCLCGSSITEARQDMQLWMNTSRASASSVDSQVTVYLTVTKHSGFSKLGSTTMALKEITVPYFDLGLYGLQNYYYNPDCYQNGAVMNAGVPGTAQTASGKVTMLHAVIYATEVYYNGLAPSKAGKGWLADEGNWNGYYLDRTQKAGSAYGSIWDFGFNANYFINYGYPVATYQGRTLYDDYGNVFGATVDQILLKDGDVISVRYNAYTGNDGTYYHFGAQGDVAMTASNTEKLALTLYSTAAGAAYGSGTDRAPYGGAKVYVTSTVPTSFSGLTPAGTTNAKGQVTIDLAGMAPGNYYVTTNTYDPAILLLTVKETGSKPGDVNSDGYITAEDATTVFAATKGSVVLTEAQRAAADMDGDGYVTAEDATRIYSMSKGS